MEYITEYLSLSIIADNTIKSSYAETIQNENYLCINFYVNANDYLFELKSDYKIQLKFLTANLKKYNEIILFKEGKQSICCTTQVKLLEIIDCKLKGFYRKVFLEGLLLQLLFQTQNTTESTTEHCEVCNFLNKPSEIDKILQAKNFIINNLEGYLTIPTISSEVGTNQCYLKKGFKEVFNQTIFDFIQENRMTKAKYLLTQNNLSITEISQKVGYSSLSSFSQAYKNYFGCNPSKEIK